MAVGSLFCNVHLLQNIPLLGRSTSLTMSSVQFVMLGLIGRILGNLKMSSELLKPLD